MNREQLVRQKVIGLVAVLFGLTFTSRVIAGGVVTVMDETHLRLALVGGGTVTFAADGVIALSNTLNVVTTTTIDGSGHAVTLSGSNAVRVITVNTPITLSLINLTIADGLAVGTNGPGAPGGIGQGGGIAFKTGTLIVSGCQFIANSAVGGDGDWTNVSVLLNGGAAFGGAIDINGGALLATNSQFYGNSATGGNGGSWGGGANVNGSGGNGLGGAIHLATNSAVIVGCIFQTNQVHGGGNNTPSIGVATAGGAMGGAIAMEGGFLTNLNCQFTGNLGSTPASGEAIFAVASQGGAVFNGGGNLVVGGGTFESNNVTGGDTYADPNSITGPGQGGAIYNGGKMSVSVSTFNWNISVGGQFGASSGEGQAGAIYNAGSATVSQSLFSSNWVQGHVGVLYNIYWYPTSDGKGGAIYNTGWIDFSACTFSGNRAIGAQAVIFPGTGSPPGQGWGGALFNVGTFHLTNDTLTANVALGGSTTFTNANNYNTSGLNGFGGALCNSATGTVVSVNCTFALNDAVGGTGMTDGIGYGGAIYSTNNTTLINTILTNGTASSNFFGVLIDDGHNLSSDGSCNFTNTGSLNNTDPLLGPLQDNGGPTPTMALLPGSPAIDAGDTAAGPWLDQRGIARPVGAAADIGAFEYYDTNSPPACFYRLSSTNANFGANGGSGTVGVVASYFCDWTAGSDSAWLAITSVTNGTGSQTLTYFVATNNSTAVPRVATLTIAGQTFTVTQLGTDVTLPTVTITSPTANSKQTNLIVTVQGTANDNVGVATVEWRLENANGVGVYQPATGTTNWAANVAALTPGGNTVRVRALDLNSNLSAEVTRTFLSVQFASLTLTTNGAGTVSPDLNGQMLQLGNSYTVTAKPGTGNVFSNWTGSVTSTVAKLTFVMGSNTVLNATFATNLFLPVQGTYNGLIVATNQSYTNSGYLSLKLASAGGVSGQMIIGGKTYSVKAQASPIGQVEIPLTGGSPKQQIMTAALQFDLTGGSGQVNGTLSDARVVNGVQQPATWVSALSGDLAGYFTKTNPAPEAGPYTLLFTGGDGVNEPAGFGYATVKVDTLGNVQMSGFLAEGTSIGQKTTISKDGRWPLFVKMSRAGNVSLLGWMTFTNQPGSNILGQVVWTKLPLAAAIYYPAGFVDTMLGVGARYVAPTNSANGILVSTNGFFQFSSGNLSSPFVNTITLSWDGKVTNTSSNALSGSINKTTGVFSGKVTVPGTTTVLPFKGAVLQGADIGYGYFLSGNRSGQVLLSH